MAVTVVDAPITTADAYPAAITVSGAATGLIVAVGHSVGFGDASGPSSVSMGGQSLTQIGAAEGAASSGHDVSLSFWALNETKIAAASNTTLSFSGGNQTGIATAYFTVAGSVDVETLSASGNISTATTGSVSLARSAGSLTFACSLHDNASFGFSNLSNPAEDNEITATNIDFVYGVEADTARTVDFTWDNVSSRNNSTLVLNVVDGLSPPTISNVDGDNAVNQGQLVNINVADFTESITSGDIGGVAFPSIPDNDPADDVIQVRMPVTLAAGTYDVTISGATETDTISGVTYAITHQYTAPYAPVDSNSLFAGQSFTEDSYFRIVTPPANGTIDAATAEANSLWGNDVDDIYTPDNGFTGDDTVTLEILYADGTTAQWTATITVEEQVDITPDPFTVDPLTNQALDQWVEFDSILVSGIDPGEQIAVVVSGTDVQYAVDSGSGYGGFSATSTNVQAGDLVKPRIRTIDDFSSEATGLISIGSESSSLSATTRAAVLPVLDTPVPNLNLGEEDVVSLDLDDYFSGASSYSLSGIPAGSGLSFTGSVLSGETNKNDVEASPYNLTATAFSADGSIQDVFEVVVVDDIAPVISIGALNTTDTTPIASGSAGDADSLVLDLEGVDVTHSSSYNITPSAGSWSQQFPELALGEYSMTLTGVDSAGNETVVTAALNVVESVATSPRGLFQPLFRSLSGSVNQTLFR